MCKARVWSVAHRRCFPSSTAIERRTSSRWVVFHSDAVAAKRALRCVGRDSSEASGSERDHVRAESRANAPQRNRRSSRDSRARRSIARRERRAGASDQSERASSSQSIRSTPSTAQSQVTRCSRCHRLYSDCYCGFPRCPSLPSLVCVRGATARVRSCATSRAIPSALAAASCRARRRNLRVRQRRG